MPPIGSNPFGIEGYKTIAFEIAEDLDWTAPDVVADPSCYSDGLFGIWKGWTELHALGLVKHRPRMLAAEPYGPLAHALARGLETPEKVASGSSIAASLTATSSRRFVKSKSSSARSTASSAIRTALRRPRPWRTRRRSWRVPASVRWSF